MINLFSGVTSTGISSSPASRLSYGSYLGTTPGLVNAIPGQ